MKRILTATAMAALGFASIAQAADMNGQWARGDGKAKVNIAPCGANVCATNTWIKPGSGSEKTGDKLIMTIKPASEGQYSGTAFDPQRDMTYKLTVTVNGDSMTTKGCVVAGLICRGVEWTRLK
jgi:uncharacterized protein (DUF2147 family)